MVWGYSKSVWMSKFERGVDGHIDMMRQNGYEIFSDKTHGMVICKGWIETR